MLFEVYKCAIEYMFYGMWVCFAEGAYGIEQMWVSRLGRVCGVGSTSSTRISTSVAYPLQFSFLRLIVF